MQVVHSEQSSPSVHLQSAQGTNASTSTSSSPHLNEQDFVKNLIKAVRSNPCLYDPSNEHYGNRHSSASVRANVWQQLCNNLGYTEDAHSLQMQWKRIRDRYVRERRKRRSASGSVEEPQTTRERHHSGASECSTSSTASASHNKYFDAMRWIDPYLADANERANPGATVSVTTNGQPPPTSSPDQQLYYMQGVDEHSGSDVMISGVRSDEVTADEDEDDDPWRTYPASTEVHDYAAAAPSSSNGHSRHVVKGRSVASSPCSTTGSDVSVGSSVPRTPAKRLRHGGVSARGAELQAPAHHQHQHHPATTATSRGVTLSSNTTPHHASSGIQRMNTNQQNVTTLGNARPVGVCRATNQDGVVTFQPNQNAGLRPKAERSNDTYIIDPTTYYLETQNGPQKMYRLVSVTSLDNTSMSMPSTSTSHTTMQSQAQQPHPSPMGGHTVNGPRRKRLAVALPTTPQTSTVNLGASTSGVNGSGQLGDDLILDDGIEERTVVIDQHTSDDSPVLMESPSSGLQHVMLSSHTAYSNPRNTGRASLGSNSGSGGAVVQTTHYHQMPAASPSTDYNADVAFQQFISQHISRMSEDEKTLAKLKMQQMIFDARFGDGTAAQMLQREQEADEMVDADIETATETARV